MPVTSKTVTYDEFVTNLEVGDEVLLTLEIAGMVFEIIMAFVGTYCDSVALFAGGDPAGPFVKAVAYDEDTVLPKVL